MLLLALALIAQSTDLPANTAEAARLCAASTMTWGSTPLEATSRTGYFTLAAARETRGTKLVGEQIADEAKLIEGLAANGKPVPLATCSKRFPLAFVTRVTLPADSFDRRLSCIMASGFVVGLSEHLKDAELSRRYGAINERFIGLVADSEFGPRGVTTQEQARPFADGYLARMVDLGSPLAIVTTCEAVFPA